MTPIPCPVPGPAQCEFIRVEQVASSSRQFNPAYLLAAAPLAAIPFLLGGGGGGGGNSATPGTPVVPSTPSGPIVLNPPIPQPSGQPSFQPTPGPSPQPTSQPEPQPTPQPIPEQGYGFAALAAGVIFWGLKHKRADFVETVNRNKSTFALLPLLATTSVFAGTAVPPVQPAPAPASVFVTRLGNSIQVMHEGKLLTLPAPAGMPKDLANYKFTLKSADGGWELCWQELEKPCPKASPVAPAPRARPVKPTPSRIMY